MTEKELQEIVYKAVLDVLKSDPEEEEEVEEEEEEEGAGEGAVKDFPGRPEALEYGRREDGSYGAMLSLFRDYMDVRGHDETAIHKRAKIVDTAIKSFNITADEFRIYANKHFR